MKIFNKPRQQAPTPEQILASIKQYRNVFGPPGKIAYLRSLVRTRKYVRTVYIHPQKSA